MSGARNPTKGKTTKVRAKKHIKSMDTTNDPSTKIIATSIAEMTATVMVTGTNEITIETSQIEKTTGTESTISITTEIITTKMMTMKRWATKIIVTRTTTGIRKTAIETDSNVLTTKSSLISNTLTRTINNSLFIRVVDTSKVSIVASITRTNLVKKRSKKRTFIGKQ